MHQRRYKENSKKYPFNTSTVESMSALRCYFLNLKDERLNDIFECCELDNTCDANEEQQDLIDTPIDIIFKDRGINTEWCTNHVIVNLKATDEQIMNDFRHWLTEYTKAIGYESHKKIFSNKDLSEWVEYRLLPYIDLMLVSKLNGELITQAKAARLIFPDEYGVDITERLRRTTKPKADWLLTEKIVTAIDEQLRI